MNSVNRNTLFHIEKDTGYSTSNDDHFHNLYEFNYYKKGHSVYIINNEMYNIESGDVVIMPPNTLHKSIHQDKSTKEKTVFYLDRNFLSTFLDSRMSLPVKPTIYHVSDNKRIEEIFDELYREFNGQKHRVYLEVLVSELIVLLQRTDKKDSAMKNESSNSIPDILKYIKEHYNTEITLKNTAEHFYLNPSYLSRIFKEQTGFSFCEYITKLRVKEANKLLTLTDMPITEIAFICGFNSSNSFCKTYKKTMGMTALEYKKMTKTKEDIFTYL